MNEKWDKRFLKLASEVATWSQDPNTQVGAIIVGPHKEIISTGYNGMPRGIDDKKLERYERPAKYLWTEHAERNAIYNCLRTGVSTNDKECIIYATLFPCADCARAIIQSGIKKVVVAQSVAENNDKWKESFEASKIMLEEARIELIIYG